jgi:hypothetical protein
VPLNNLLFLLLIKVQAVVKLSEDNGSAYGVGRHFVPLNSLLFRLLIKKYRPLSSYLKITASQTE